ncbi:beta-mannosidase [Rhizobium mesoamericanum]|nr:beta-mannosidase [Rhizobium mesoamericanum]
MQGRLADISGDTLQSDGWNLVLTDAAACASPSDLSLSAVFPTPVPGTVAEALEKAVLFDRGHPHPLNGRDACYLCRLVDVNAGDAVLRLEGLATFCEVFLNGQKILVSASMFEAHDLAVHLHGGDELALCFRALEPGLGEPGPRARWRPQMITPQGLRLVRTTLLGHMPSWCPEIHAVGPWRPVSLLHPHKPIIRGLSLRPDLLEDGEGRLYASLSIEEHVSEVTLRCGEIDQAFERNSRGHCAAILKVPGVTPWWPHTHEIPHLHQVTLIIEDVEHPLGRTGFRRLAIDRGADGRDFGLLVHGERIFCRGAVWTTADIVRLPGGRDDYEPWLRLAAEADMNMIRIGGTMVYETPDFFRLCDEFGRSCGRISCSPISIVRKATRLLTLMSKRKWRRFFPPRDCRHHSPSFAAAARSTSWRRCSACRSDCRRARSWKRSCRRLPDCFARMSPMSSIRP